MKKLISEFKDIVIILFWIIITYLTTIFPLYISVYYMENNIDYSTLCDNNLHYKKGI